MTLYTLWTASIIVLALGIVVDIYKIYSLKKTADRIEKIRDEMKEQFSSEAIANEITDRVYQKLVFKKVFRG